MRRGNLEQKLLMAVRKNHLRDVRYLVSKGANVNAQDYYGITILKHAVVNGHRRITKCLVENGADVNFIDDSEIHALMVASSAGNLEIVKILLRNGANVNARNLYGYNILNAAISGRYLEVVKLLVEYGADVNALDADMDSALMVASYEGDLKIVEFLIAKGADVHAKNSYGNGILNVAVKNGYLEVVKILVENGADVDVPDGSTKASSLIIAAELNYFEIVKFLVENGADVGAKDSIGRDALICATMHNRKMSFRVVQYLIENGADVDQHRWIAITNPELKNMCQKAAILKMVESQMKNLVIDQDLMQEQYVAFIKEEVRQRVKLNSRLLLHVLQHGENLQEALKPVKPIEKNFFQMIWEMIIYIFCSIFGIEQKFEPLALQIAYKKVSEIAKSGQMGNVCARRVREFGNRNLYEPVGDVSCVSPNIAGFKSSIERNDQVRINAIFDRVNDILEQNELSLANIQFALDFINYDYGETLFNFVTDFENLLPDALQKSMNQEKIQELGFVDRIRNAAFQGQQR